MTKLFCWVNREYEHSESAPRCSDCLRGRQQQCSPHLTTFLFENPLQLHLGRHVWTQTLFAQNILKQKETLGVKMWRVSKRRKHAGPSK